MPSDEEILLDFAFSEIEDGIPLPSPPRLGENAL